MDHAALELHLAHVTQHIEEAAEHIIKQETLITELDRHGHDTTEAKKLLAVLREAHAVHVESRDRVSKELNDQDPS